MSAEEKKERRKKQAKYLGIACVAGFAFLFCNVMYKNYRNNKAEELKLSSDRNKYYKEAFENKDRSVVSEEFFNEMFMTGDDWYSIDSERSEKLENLTKESKGDLNMAVTLFNALRYVEIECECTFEEDMTQYAEFLGVMNKELWDSGENTDISLRLYSRTGDQIVLYCYNGEKFLDYNFMNEELEQKWASVRNTNNLSEFKTIEYKEIVVDEEQVIEELDEFGTVIPFITDELIKAYNDEKQVKIVLKSDKYLGYDYLSEGQINSMVDDNYYSNISDEGDVPDVDGSEVEDENSSESEKSDSKTIPLSELDYNTKEIVYLSPDDYCEYSMYVENNDLDYNPNIKATETTAEDVNEEQYYDSTSWICIFGNPRLFDDISHIASKVNSSNVSYQLMYYLYQTDNVSVDLGAGLEEIIAKFS